MSTASCALYGYGVGSVTSLGGVVTTEQATFVVSGNTLYVSGTSGNDTFTFTPDGLLR